MTINFPKFPNDRRDKNRPIDPNRAVVSSLNPLSADSTLPVGDNPAHNRSHHDMLTQTDQLQSEADSHTEAQHNLLKKTLKNQILPPQKNKSLPLMPILLGLLLLAGGGILGYMYQAYSQPPASAPVPAKATPSPVPPQAIAPTSASSVAGNTVPAIMPSVAVVPTVPVSDKATVAAEGNPASPITPTPKLAPSDTPPMPQPINSDANPNTHGSNATGNMTHPPSTAKPAPAEVIMPANANAQPVTSPETSAPAKPAESPSKNARSYDDFVKTSENTLFIEPPPHR